MKLVRFALSLVLVLPVPAFSATLPPGFIETAITGLNAPTAMQFAPDGRLFICEQGGRVRVVRDGSLLATPFLTIPAASINSSGERGIAVAGSEAVISSSTT